jgi:DNA polymerase epsilon subunit 3
MSELDVELPKAVVKRIVRAKLAEKMKEGDDDMHVDFQVNKDALSAFAQATKVFITYVTTAANDICRENKRTTVATQDILQALKDLDFHAFIPGLEEHLVGAPSRFCRPLALEARC